MWTMRDGTKIAIRDMTDSHLRNALRVLVRAAIVQRAKDVSTPCPFGGDGAIDAFDDAMAELIEQSPEEIAAELWPEFARLEKEAERRDLDWAYTSEQIANLENRALVLVLKRRHAHA